VERAVGVESPPTRGTGRQTTAAAEPAPAKPAVAEQSNAWLVPVLMLVIGNFMAVLDVTIVNVAVSAIQKDFGASTDDVLWIATAYTLMLGVVVPASGWLGDRFGLHGVYVMSLLGFAVGSALCALAGNLGTLIAFRVVQAIFGGILPVVAMSLLYRIVPRDKIGTAMGIFGVGSVFAPAAGPVLGGYLVEYFNWRLVFYINVPIGVVGAVAAYFVVPKLGRAAARRFDVAGFLTSAFGLFAVLLAVSQGSQWGWTSYPILILIAAGVNSLVLFVLVELEVKQPLLDLRVLRSGTFTRSVVMMAVLQINLLTIFFYAPLFLQQDQNLPAFNAGLLLLPQAILMGILMPITGRIYDKVGPRWVTVIGIGIAAYGTFLLTNITIDVTHDALIGWTCVRGLGLGLSMMTIMTAGIAAVDPSATNQASAMFNVARQVSGALGLAAYSALATAQQAQLLADRAPLLTNTGPGTDPRVQAMQAKGPGGMLPLWQQLQAEVHAQSESNIFLITSALSAGTLLLAFALPASRNKT
jgi:EmrB/QacA subfamily drug resistance transporter